ncbi:hypothetical protein EDD11_008515 [Mortierella claussenii]|nr:hypothetical protein EDD11_008515 [Mortierella claussenii]
MSDKLTSTAPSPSIASLASKVISRLANSSRNNNIQSNHSVADEDEDSEENEENDEDAGIIRCICNYTDDDGFTIQCERCFVWQHAVCVGIVQSNVPDKYLCELCSPRAVDRKRANEIQRRRTGTVERKREKSPSRRKPSVGRPRKQFGSTSSGLSEQGVALVSSNSKDNGTHQSTSGSGLSNGYQGKGTPPLPDFNGKKAKGNGGGKQPSSQSYVHHTNSPATSSHQQYALSKHKGQATSSRMSSTTNDEDDLDMESDSQDDAQDAYQCEFTSVDTNIVTSKAVQDLFRQVIAQFRQAQSRKRSLSLTSGVKLQELVASDTSAANNSNSTPPIPENLDPSLAALGSQPPPVPPASSTVPSNVVSMERESLARPLMKTTVKHILPSSRSGHSPAPQYGLFTESNIGAGRFMMEFKGEVSLKSAYKSDPINQYSILATPKPFVLFHPHLNLVVDARRSGNDARFARRSCIPNTEVKSIVVPGVQDQTVHLGLFAKVPIGKGEEITLDWDWNRDHLALQSIKALVEKSKDVSVKKSAKEIRKAKHLVASTLLAQTDCACENKDNCVLHQMLKDGMAETGTRDQEPSATKGNRSKKTVASESLRQRYGGQRERSEGKRSAEQGTSDEELSAAESSSRHKSPKAIKMESSSKKARHGSYSNQRLARTDQEVESESDSDDHRRRKQTLPEKQGSPFKRSDIASPEMSAREMKQALMLIKKMEDRDASSTAHSKHMPTDIRSVTVSPKSRTRDNGRSQEGDPTFNSSRKKVSTMEDDEVSIGDSGIDSDSNNGMQRRDTLDRNVPSSNKRLQAIQLQDKRDREHLDQDAASQSSAVSDSERAETANRLSRQAHATQSGKKQPYAAASREKRMAEHSSAKSLSKNRLVAQGLDLQEDLPDLSRSSSVEGSFVSIVGNTSDEEEELHHKTDRKLLREQNLPKETLPAASLRPSVLPCKKVWKMIYLRQRAVAEEEARERAEEIRKKAEEVFDLKMEEDETLISSSLPVVVADMTTADSPSPKADTHQQLKEPTPSGATQDVPTQPDQLSSIVEGDVLNLFHEDVNPESSSSISNKYGLESHRESTIETKITPRTSVIHQPVVIMPSTASQETSIHSNTFSSEDQPRTSQKLSLQSYHAKRLASSSPALPQDPNGPSYATNTMTEAAQNAAEVVDVEMSGPEPATLATSGTSKEGVMTQETVMPHAAVQEALASKIKIEAAPVVPKVKLSLQEYQKQRQEASQRSNGNLGGETAKPTVEDEDNVHKQGGDIEGKALQSLTSTELMDVDSKEPLQKSTAEAERGQSVRGDYFQVGASLPTPLIGLSSRVQEGSQSLGDYFPVQPFSPVSLSAGPTSFSKLNLTSSPSEAHIPITTSSTADTRSPGKLSTAQRSVHNLSPRESQGKSADSRSPKAKSGSSPPLSSQGSSGWTTPRSQRGHSPPPRPSDSKPTDGRLASPRFYGSPSERPERLSSGALNSPTRERQHSLTSGTLPSSPFEASHYYGLTEDAFKRSGMLSSPTGHPAGGGGSRDYYKGEERVRHRSMNGDEWGFGDMDPPNYGGYRGLRGGPPPPPRDRDRERDRERDHERERERRERFERRGDYFVSGPHGSGVGGPVAAGMSGAGFFGPNRGPRGPGGIGGGGGYGRRPNDYYGGPGREESYGGHGPSSKKDGPSDNASLSF